VARREYRRNLREVVLEKLRQEGRIGDDADPKWVLRACLTHMAQYGEPLFVVSNLEDLWLSGEPQNRPGTTWTQQPNWQTKAAHSLEALDGLPGLRDTLRSLDAAVRSRR
jgi:4-alpha-glucanotransferase